MGGNLSICCRFEPISASFDNCQITLVPAFNARKVNRSQTPLCHIGKHHPGCFTGLRSSLAGILQKAAKIRTGWWRLSGSKLAIPGENLTAPKNKQISFMTPPPLFLTYGWQFEDGCHRFGGSLPFVLVTEKFGSREIAVQKSLPSKLMFEFLT